MHGTRTDKDVTPDTRAAAVAQRQLGLITVEQAREAGLSDKAIKHRRRTGRWVPVRRGVFAIGGAPPTPDHHVLAGVLAAGTTAAASHLTAAALFGLPAPEPDLIEVTTVLETHRRIPGVRAHRSGLLRDRDRTTLRCIPVHTPERTACDLSGRLDDKALAVLVGEALRRRVTSPLRLVRTHERLPLAPGRNPKRMQRVLDNVIAEAGVRESTFEDRVFEALRAAGLPLPVAQHRVVLAGGHRRIDLAYPDAKIAIECDGFEWHHGRAAFDDDRARRNELELAGWHVLHVTWAMTDEQIVTLVRRALEAFGQLRAP
jgi:very-short-patch-repair endonuclease